MFDGHQTLLVWKESVAGDLAGYSEGRVGAAAPFNALLSSKNQFVQLGDAQAVDAAAVFDFQLAATFHQAGAADALDGLDRLRRSGGGNWVGGNRGHRRGSGNHLRFSLIRMIRICIHY
jgi:hypothetical protein